MTLRNERCDDKDAHRILFYLLGFHVFCMFHLRHLIKLLCWPGTSFYTLVVSVSSTDVFLFDIIYCALLLYKAGSPLFAMGRKRSGNFDRRFARELIKLVFV